ncbi:uncharacterized protein LOC142765981 [Rhipicephalus microplus]|uniref:uncharacterized protein LOC142765981 n=1 Tax=Rhipicephalus microplus TaxID=6941 RepID=UPI003F6D0C97
MPVMAGKVAGRRVDVLRETGCSTVIVRRDLVRDNELTGQTSLIYTVDRSVMRLPEAKVKIETPFYSGTVSAFCMKDPLYDVIAGNIVGARSPDQPEPLEEDPEINPPSIANPHNQPAASDEDVVTVTTRAQTKAQSKPFQPLPAPNSEEDSSFSYAEEQIQDESLKPCFAQIDKDLRCRNSKCAIMFKQEDGLLYRYYTGRSGRRIRQLLEPKNRRESVMKLAHDGIMAGHLGAQKTKDKIQEEFFWPGVTADVKRFVASCDICLRTVPKGRVPHVSLGQSPVIDTPFKRVAINIVGPIRPPSCPGNRYILTLVDCATRYPEAGFLGSLLFAYREVPQASLGFSPFELLYGRHVRGPLAILKEVWTNQELDDELKTTYQYVLDLRNRLEETCRLAHEELRRAGARYAKHFNRKSRDRIFKPGDKVLILLPTDKNTLLMHWKGSFKVQATIGDFDYSIKTPSGPTIFHANLLKKYAERETNRDAPHQCQVIVGVVDNGDEQELPVPEFVQTEGITDVKICPSLTDQQKEALEKTMTAHSKIFSNVPGKTDWVECHLETVTKSPVHVKQYPLPFATTKDIELEVEQMKTLGIFEVSKSPYNSPVLLVDKPDKTKWFVVDLRRLNNLIIADAVFASATNKRYFSKLDFVKGYWQIPLSQQSKPKTAFSTKSGLYQFCYMPFGIKTAPAVFTRLMRLVTEVIPGVEHYIRRRTHNKHDLGGTPIHSQTTLRSNSGCRVDRETEQVEDTHLSKVVVLVGLCLLLAAVITAIVAVSNHYSRDDEDGDGEGMENDQPSFPSGGNGYVTTKMLVCTFGHLGVLPAMIPPDGTCDIIFYEEVYYNQKKKSIQPTHSARSFHVLQSLNATYTMTTFGTSMATGAIAQSVHNDKADVMAAMETLFASGMVHFGMLNVADFENYKKGGSMLYLQVAAVYAIQ